ncbi:MAG: adenylate/guanylate cyclase domain-containing protein [Verrucomicrobiota bacterium]|nr:adenylate/guanylate cyclase domain-containing protein [Verrucomicrobiota bacterium]
MISIGFRVKLLLSMLLVVALTTAVSLMVSLKRVEQANDHLFRVRVEEQLQYLPQEQADRLNEAQAQAARFLEREEVQVALEEKDANGLYKLTWQTMAPVLAEPLLKKFIKSEEPPDEPPVIHVPKRRFRITATHLVFLGEKGEFLLPERSINGYFQSRGQREFRAKLDDLYQGLMGLDKSATGYLSVGNQNGTRRLLEVVCLPAKQAEGGKTVGTMILGFPVNRRSEQALNEISDLSSGVWVDGALLSSTIAEADLPKVVQWLEKNALITKGTQADKHEFLELNGVPHKVFVAPMGSHPALPKAHKVGLYDWSQSLVVQDDIKAQILGIGAIMGFVAVGLSWLISLGLFKPLRRLYRATMQLREGDYDVRVPVRGNDELGRLAAAFNETAEELALKNRYRDVLNKVADKEVAEELMAGNGHLGGKTHQMTVVFCDMRKYTEITQSMSPEEAVTLLNEHMTALTRVVHEQGGLVDKFVGDMIMAVFGAGERDSEAAVKAVACARAMISERKVLNMMTGRNIRVGVGVATGKMLAGFMGSEERLNFTVIGQGANLASRLCTVAGPMDILVDEATCEAAREGRTAEPLPPMEIKGFSELQAVYRLRPVSTAQVEPETTVHPAL